ncbi:MHYT domain-containing protein [Mesorhizobium retamae]|uniref:MHYT domain-containing protein n=1 Tax=Mesorhizobium retamae TaxID=2912854 RepID=A0ABS9QNU1_9HYPH|nr:MHYT domain-containing protein [Mesorhizobium sp. IRAMC:0171]MCG7509104.1 hypothetical protein [Mesorhizobium sp. IRAMC:0171]
MQTKFIFATFVNFAFIYIGLFYIFRELTSVKPVRTSGLGILRTGTALGVLMWSSTLLSFMLARHGLRDVFEAVPLFAALLIAVMGCCYGTALIMATSFRNASVFGGAAIGFTVAFTHFATMIGRHPSTPYEWRLDPLLLALAMAIVFSALALRIIATKPFSRSFEIGCATLAAGTSVTLAFSLQAVLPLSATA